MKLLLIIALFVTVNGMAQDRFKIPINSNWFNDFTAELHNESIIEIEYEEGRSGNMSITGNGNSVTFSGAIIIILRSDFHIKDDGVTKISYRCMSGEIWLRNGHNKIPPESGIIKGIDNSTLKSGTVVLDENNPGAIRNATFAEELLFLLQDYETECYNDSTHATYDFYVWDNDTIKSYPSIDPGHTPGYIGTKMIYEHKEPTFKGFIEWLKENEHRK